LDFIHADGIDLAQFALCQSPLDDVFDGIENLIPGSAERHGRFLPGKPTCPTGQKQHVGFGQRVFAVTLGNFLDHHSVAAAAVDAAHGVEEKDKESPQGDELETPLPELIVTGRRQMAARADCDGTLARSYGHLDALLVGTEVGLLVDKTPETMAAV